MSGVSGRQRSAPVVLCDDETARRLGAVAVDEDQAARSRKPAFHIVTREGNRWIWPVEKGFNQTVDRRRR